MNDRDDDFDDRDDAFDPYDDAGSRRLPQGVVLFAAALLTLVGFAAVVLIAYNLGVQDGLKRAPTVVAAPEGPYRTPPTEDDGPSGFVAPHQDREILARAEYDDGGEDAAPPPDYGREAEQLDSLIEDRVSAPPTDTETTPAEAAQDVPAEQVATPPTTRPAEPIDETPAPRPSEPSPSTTRPEPRETAPASVDAAAEDSYFVQVASVLTNAEDADREWGRFDSRFGETVPSGRGKDVRRVELPDGRIAFRVRVGPFADRPSASEYCDTLKAREQSCLVTKG